MSFYNSLMKYKVKQKTRKITYNVMLIEWIDSGQSRTDSILINRRRGGGAEDRHKSNISLDWFVAKLLHSLIPEGCGGMDSTLRDPTLHSEMTAQQREEISFADRFAKSDNDNANVYKVRQMETSTSTHAGL